METTLGGKRLGSGGKNVVTTKHYNMSTHNQSRVLRTTASVGTLVPCFLDIGTPNTTFDIDINAEVISLPTNGPLFGTEKVQIDFFTIPLRLYHKELMFNKTQVGKKMQEILLPQMYVIAPPIDRKKPLDSQQINPSSLLSYLGIAGCGNTRDVSGDYISRMFLGTYYLAYWDIYKNFYANKQEKIGVMIHNSIDDLATTVSDCKIHNIVGLTVPDPWGIPNTGATVEKFEMQEDTYLEFVMSPYEECDIDRFTLRRWNTATGEIESIDVLHYFQNYRWNEASNSLIFSKPIRTDNINQWISYNFNNDYRKGNEPQLVTFPLENIDLMTEKIMSQANTSALVLDQTDDAPYGLPLLSNAFNLQNEWRSSSSQKQEGLACKTYQSDLNNNWLDNEDITAVNEATRISTTAGFFSINDFMMKEKLFDILNMVNVAGGSMEDWVEAVYDVKASRKINNPIYEGGLSKELIFQAITSTAQTDTQPLATLGGRGMLSGKHKGGKVRISCGDEPCMIIGIYSQTPRIDYSQGNMWFNNLKSIDDLHKPGLDAIAFQDKITDEMAWWDTPLDYTASPTIGVPKFKSAGKQPAWINYTSSLNQVKGNFALQNDSDFMVFNRNYEAGMDTGGNIEISDLTTYIDPKKYNYPFAEARRDTMNYWVQIAFDVETRRKMSYKQIPNL